MNHIFHLDNCTSCRRIIKDVRPGKHYVLQNLKEKPLTADQLDFLKNSVGSYELLFNKQSRKYREYSLYQKELTEDDYREWLLKEYTFLKRPIFVVNSKVYICRGKETLNALKAIVQSNN